MPLIFCPFRCSAAEYPEQVEKLLQDSPFSVEKITEWDISDLWESLVQQVMQTPIQFVRSMAGLAAFALFACLILGITGGKTWRSCAELAAVLVFAVSGLGQIKEILEELQETATESQTYLATFVPVYSGMALAMGQTTGSMVYSGMFLTMSGFLAEAIQMVLLPVLKIYFCVSVCAVLWGNNGAATAAHLFSDCFTWLLKGCGTLFGAILGLQNVLAAATDTAAVRLGKGVLQASIPVVGGVASAALSGAVSALQMVKASLALALVGAVGGLFLPLFLKCILCRLIFLTLGILSELCDLPKCGRLCTLYAQGSRLCMSIQMLYLFIVLLSTILLLLTGMGVA